MFNYRTLYTLNGRRYVSNCYRSFDIANAVARKRIEEGATDVVIEVKQEKTTDDADEDPTWPPISAA